MKLCIPELFIFTIVLPCITEFKDNPLNDLEQIMQGNGFVKTFYENENYLKYVKRALPTFLFNGYLD